MYVILQRYMMVGPNAHMDDDDHAPVLLLLVSICNTLAASEDLKSQQLRSLVYNYAFSFNPAG